jgi:cobyrinic acid a,c-diamide synthase
VARGFMVAGTTSGVGKTMLTLGLIGALVRRGLKVQPFKTGPDYIDPSYHTRAAGVPSRNLDTWLVPHAAIVELFARTMHGRDIAVVEGVMGLYDGRSARSEEGSGAELAKLLGLPILLVVDASAVARSVAATVLGFQQFDPKVRLAGVVLNGVGSEGHTSLCGAAIELASGLPVVGALRRRDDLMLPERHLGLIPTVEGATADAVFHRITNAVEAAVDLERLLALTELDPIAMPHPAHASLFPDKPVPPLARIAVAMDRAFSFYYQDSLDLLEAWGTEVAPFSPLEDAALPRGTTGVYIGGGFPELYARELATNQAIACALRQAADRRVPIYAECGGLMYLGQSIADFQGVTHPMVGLVPTCSHLTGTRLTLGYRNIRALADGPLLRKGQQVRGHEFHWSRLGEDVPPADAAYEVIDQGGQREGFRRGSVLASYVHLHLASDPRLAPRFVGSCRSREVLR